MTLPNRGTFLQTGTLTNQQAAEAHAAVRDCVAMNGTLWESATPYIHPCMTRGSDGKLYDSIQSSTGQNPTTPLSAYWELHIKNASETDKGIVSKATPTEVRNHDDNGKFISPDLLDSGGLTFETLEPNWSGLLYFHEGVGGSIITITLSDIERGSTSGDICCFLTTFTPAVIYNQIMLATNGNLYQVRIATNGSVTIRDLSGNIVPGPWGFSVNGSLTYVADRQGV